MEHSFYEGTRVTFNLRYYQTTCVKLMIQMLNLQMFTNGMSETLAEKIFLIDVPLDVFRILLEFMYNGGFSKEDTMDIGTQLLQLLLLADQFGVSLLHQECCKTLLECLSEVI